MKRPAVRCRCGHQVLAKEVLRTDLYERPSGREYVYVKFRCKRCKRMGETFVAENRWDWRIFEAKRNELSDSESELFSDQAPISSEELLDFHRQLATVATPRDLVLCDGSPAVSPTDAPEPVAGEKSAAIDVATGESPEALEADSTSRAARTEPKRTDHDAKKDINKKDAEKTGRPEDGNNR